MRSDVFVPSRKNGTVCLAVLGALLLQACATAPSRDGLISDTKSAVGYVFPWFGQNRVDMSGVRPMLPVQYEEVDLVGLLDPEGACRTDTTSAGSDETNSNTKRSGVVRSDEAQIACALRKIQEMKEENERIASRDYIQDYLMAMSDQRCHSFLSYFEYNANNTGFVVGSASTLLGGMGAIFSSASTVRALSGSAAIASGVRAEFEQSYLRSKSAELIRKGINSRRDKIRGEIAKFRVVTGSDNKQEPKDTKLYGVMAAVDDALVYHRSCSVSAGLEEAISNIESNKTIGLDTLKSSLTALEAINIQAKKAAEAGGETVAAGGGVAKSGAAGSESSAATTPARPATRVLADPK